MMEDHNRLLPATESGSGLVNNAMRSRSVMVLGCVLVALGSLLCVGKESQAEPPAQAPEPGGSATSQRPAGHDPPRAPTADQRARVAQQEPVARGPASRPAHQPPNGRTAPDQRPATEAPGRQVALQGKTAHEPSWEQGRDPGPREPVGQDPEHQRPQPQKSDKDHVSRPVHEQPVPQTSHNSHGSESSGQQVEEGTGAADQHSKPAIPLGKENVYPEGKSSAGPPEQSPRPFEHVVAAGPKSDKTAGNGAYKPDAPKEESPILGHPDHTG